MTEVQHRWYMEQLTAPAMLHRNAIRMGDWCFQTWRKSQDATTSITYARAWKIVTELSAGLIDLGVRKGDRCAVMAETCPEWVWADYSILTAGAITVCVHPTLPAQEVAYILRDSGVKILYLDDEDHLKKITSVWDELPCLEKVIMMRDGYGSEDKRILSFSGVTSSGLALLARDSHVVDHRWRAIQLHDYMTIVYTSGTTGEPKGVIHTHFSFNSAILRDLHDGPLVNHGDVFLSFLPLSHTYEREAGHGCAMMAAGTIAYSSPRTLIEDLKIFRPHVIISVPRIYERVYKAIKERAAKSFLKRWLFNTAMKISMSIIATNCDQTGFVNIDEGTNLSAKAGFFTRIIYHICDKLVFAKVREQFGGRTRVVFSAAGSLPADLCKTFMAMGFIILEGYGLTETWNTINLNRLGKILPGSVGRLSHRVTGRIATDGEWQVKGDNLFVGYWNRPEDTAAAFTRDGFFKTGDIVEEVADGYIKIVDRKKGIMVLDTGKNVPSARIESLFALSKYIDLVVPVGDDRKFVSALVVPNFNALIALCQTSGIDYDKAQLEFIDDAASLMYTRIGNDVLNHAVVRRCIEADIQSANMELKEHERIKKFHIVNRKLSEKMGEITPTLKVKRKEVIAKFKQEIDELYS